MLAEMNMNEAAVWVAAISAVAALITSYLNNRKLAKVPTAIAAIVSPTIKDVVHTEFNSRVDELVRAGVARGRLEERESQIIRDKEKK